MKNSRRKNKEGERIRSKFKTIDKARLVKRITVLKRQPVLHIQHKHDKIGCIKIKGYSAMSCARFATSFEKKKTTKTRRKIQISITI